MNITKGISKSLATFFVATGFISSGFAAQEATAKAKPTLEELAGSLLFFPQVQAELKLTDEQIGKLIARSFIGKSRGGLKAVVEYVKSEDKSDFLGNLITGLVPDELDKMLPLRYSDLKEAQKTRLKQITSQIMVIESVSTDELAKVLGLSDSQRAKVKEIGDDAPEFNFDSKEDQEKIGALAKEIAELTSTEEQLKIHIDDFVKKSTLLFDAFENLIVKGFVAFMADSIRSNRKQKDQFFELLSADQLKKLREFQGTPTRIDLF